MANSVKNVQEKWKKGGKKKESSDPPPAPVAPAATPTAQPVRNPNAHMATVLTGVTVSDYDLCASFIADNGSDAHVINRFYRDRLTNIRPAVDMVVRHGLNMTPVELIGDAYYYAYDGHDRLFRFDISGVLYVPDFMTNIVSMRLAKQRANLFFETQFGQMYDANGYIHATTQEICNQWVLEYAHPASISTTALAKIQQNTERKSKPRVIHQLPEATTGSEIPELPDTAQADANYYHEDPTDVGPLILPLRGYDDREVETEAKNGDNNDSHGNQLHTPDPTPAAPESTNTAPIADPETPTQSGPQHDETENPDPPQFDETDNLVDQLVDTSNRPEKKKPTQTVSADLNPEHIIHGKRTRKQTDRAVHTVVTKSSVQLDSSLFFHSFLSMIDHPNRPRHQLEMPPYPKNYRDLWNHPERDGVIKDCEHEIERLKERKTFQVVTKTNNSYIIPLMIVVNYAMLIFTSIGFAKGFRMELRALY